METFIFKLTFDGSNPDTNKSSEYDKFIYLNIYPKQLIQLVPRPYEYSPIKMGLKSHEFIR